MIACQERITTRTPGGANRATASLSGVAVSSASEHLSLLRDAGLVSSTRDANTVLHTTTTVGDLLLAGDPG